MMTDSIKCTHPASKRKPAILFLCDRRGWAFDTTARQLAKYLSDEFITDIKFVAESPEIDRDMYDLVYVFWWGEKYHRKYFFAKEKVIKEISSHRWALEEQYGRHTPTEAVERYMHDAGYLVTTSLKLNRLFSGCHPHVYHYPLGVDTDLFRPINDRSGELKIGWAGNLRDPLKRVRELLIPACEGRFELKVADGGLSHEEMCDFYNQLDIICIASEAEGTPLPLIEAMACGCFPVTTDVGVVGELIVNGQNGLIVEADQKAFRQAFEWCQNNLEKIRDAGSRNAALVRDRRTWAISARQLSDVFHDILSSKKERAMNKEKSTRNVSYASHFQNINPGGFLDETYHSSCSYYREDVEHLLPEKKDSRILEVGTGYGHFLRFLSDQGYQRVTGIDICPELLDQVREHLGNRVEKLEVADAKFYLPQYPEAFDCIVMLDMLEHVTFEEAEKLLVSAHNALKPGGRLILRTPNMANLLGCYSLYMDSTHRYGYTEWSLVHLLEQANFRQPQLHVPTHFSSNKRRFFSWLNKLIHKFIYHINDRAVPKWFGKNIVVSGLR